MNFLVRYNCTIKGFLQHPLNGLRSMIVFSEYLHTGPHNSQAYPAREMLGKLSAIILHYS